MATKRRGGFRAPELRGTLGTLLRTTTDVVRGALERGAREGRARLDDVRTHRRRQDALAELGDVVLDLIRRGEIDLAELPEARDLVRVLDDFDAEDADEPAPPRAITRRRFDDRPAPRAAASPLRRNDGVVAGTRPRRSQDDDGVVASGARSRRDHDDDGVVASSARPRRGQDDDGVVASGARPHRDHDDDEDGAAGSRLARPTTPARPRPGDRSSSRTAVLPRPDATMPPRRSSLTLPHDPHRKGGISFDDDDLNEYMHPDDVPAKSPPKDPDDGAA